jgi:arylsulfatase A-like enzyme
VERLKGAGYWTAAAGKWHLGEGVKDRFDLVREADVSGFQLPASGDVAESKMVARQKSGCEEWIATLRGRPEDRPFFLWLAALDPHRDYEPGIISRPHGPEEVVLPPYLPDHPNVRKEFALYYDEITRLDGYVGGILDELERQGIADDTVVLFLSDNGRPFPRDKTTLYDGGIKTPLIVRWPGEVTPGTVCDQLVSAVDIAPTILSIAGIEIPEPFQGISFTPLLSDPSVKIRDFIFAEDHWHDFEDMTRAVRSQRYKYIRNDYADLAATPSADVLRSPTFQLMRARMKRGVLTAAQKACFVAPRPKEEFYDLRSDPFELNNLIHDPGHAGRIDEHRRALEDWTARTVFKIPAERTADEFDRDTGAPLPNRIRPRPSKQVMLNNRRM